MYIVNIVPKISSQFIYFENKNIKDYLEHYHNSNMFIL